MDTGVNSLLDGVPEDVHAKLLELVDTISPCKNALSIRVQLGTLLTFNEDVIRGAKRGEQIDIVTRGEDRDVIVAARRRGWFVDFKTVTVPDDSGNKIENLKVLVEHHGNNDRGGNYNFCTFLDLDQQELGELLATTFILHHDPAMRRVSRSVKIGDFIASQYDAAGNRKPSAYKCLPPTLLKAHEDSDDTIESCRALNNLDHKALTAHYYAKGVEELGSQVNQEAEALLQSNDEGKVGQVLEAEYTLQENREERSKDPVQDVRSKRAMCAYGGGNAFTKFVRLFQHVIASADGPINWILLIGSGSRLTSGMVDACTRLFPGVQIVCVDPAIDFDSPDSLPHPKPEFHQLAISDFVDVGMLDKYIRTFGVSFLVVSDAAIGTDTTGTVGCDAIGTNDLAAYVLNEVIPVSTLSCGHTVKLIAGTNLHYGLAANKAGQWTTIHPNRIHNLELFVTRAAIGFSIAHLNLARCLISQRGDLIRMDYYREETSFGLVFAEGCIKNFTRRVIHAPKSVAGPRTGSGAVPPVPVHPRSNAAQYRAEKVTQPTPTQTEDTSGVRDIVGNAVLQEESFNSLMACIGPILCSAVQSKLTKAQLCDQLGIDSYYWLIPAGQKGGGGFRFWGKNSRDTPIRSYVAYLDQQPEFSARGYDEIVSMVANFLIAPGACSLSKGGTQALATMLLETAFSKNIFVWSIEDGQMVVRKR